MVNKGVINLIEPWMDIATTVSSSTAWRIGRSAKKHLGYTVTKFFGIKDWNLIFTSIMPLQDPEVVIYTGHGFPDRWLGDDLILGTLRESQSYLLKDRVVIAVPSCLTARQMGHTAIAEGAKVYVGSTDLVYIAWDEWDHPYRRDFEFSWFELVFNILSGVSPGSAVSNYRNTCNRFIKTYQTLDLPNGDYYIDAMQNNRDGMVALGDKNYTLTPPEYRDDLISPKIKEFNNYGLIQ